MITRFRQHVGRWQRRLYDVASIPIAASLLFDGQRVHSSYAMSWKRRIALAARMYRNTRHVRTGTSFKAHLAMAAKLLEIPPDREGVVVECGCWLGGSTANLSLVCDIVGRDLIVYDSFEGLPVPDPRDKFAWQPGTGAGEYRGDLDVVRAHVERYGALERCHFRKGWFEDTLRHHTEPIVLCFLDVDYQTSLHQCVVDLWPHLTDEGYLFIDEYVHLDYCALFFSERFWKEQFNARPPGLLGTGTGVGVGQYYLGPWRWEIDPTSVAYTQKGSTGFWAYDPSAPTP